MRRRARGPLRATDCVFRRETVRTRPAGSAVLHRCGAGRETRGAWRLFSRTPRRFDRQLFAVAPFAPRAEIIADAIEARQTQGVVGVSGAIAALTIGNDFLIGGKSKRFEHRPQFLRRLEFPGFIQVQQPVAINRAGNRAAAFGAHVLAVVFGFAAHVENAHRAVAQGIGYLFKCRQDFRTGRRSETRRPDWIGYRLKLHAIQRLQTAVENLYRGMAEIFENPGPARRPHPGVVFIKHHRFLSGDSQRRKDPFGLLGELADRLGTGVVIMKWERIEMACVREVSGPELLRCAGIDQYEIPRGGTFKPICIDKELTHFPPVRPSFAQLWRLFPLWSILGAGFLPGKNIAPDFRLPYQARQWLIVRGAMFPRVEVQQAMRRQSFRPSRLLQNWTRRERVDVTDA